SRSPGALSGRLACPNHCLGRLREADHRRAWQPRWHLGGGAGLAASSAQWPPCGPAAAALAAAGLVRRPPRPMRSGNVPRGLRGLAAPPQRGPAPAARYGGAPQRGGAGQLDDVAGAGVGGPGVVAVASAGLGAGERGGPPTRAPTLCASPGTTGETAR